MTDSHSNPCFISVSSNTQMSCCLYSLHRRSGFIIQVFTATSLQFLPPLLCQNFYYSTCCTFFFFPLMYRSHTATPSNTHSCSYFPLCRKVILVMSKHTPAININGNYISIHIRERTDLSDVKGNFIKKQGNFS